MSSIDLANAFFLGYFVTLLPLQHKSEGGPAYPQQQQQQQMKAIMRITRTTRTAIS